MIIVRNISVLSACLPGGSAVTWGNFDGVHLGHQALLDKLAAKAKALHLPAVALTFDPHPALFFNPLGASRALTSLEDKLTLLALSGLHYALILPFNAAFARQSPQEFARHILIQGLRAKTLVLGYDVGFGQGREGDAALLRRLGAEQGLSVEETPPLILPGQGPAASTAAREAVKSGDFPLAASILGRAHSVHGLVRRGTARGGELLGFPTANMDPGPLLLPPRGVYACLAKTGGILYPAAVNLGLNPSFGGGELSLEAHLLDFNGDLYGRELRLYFLRFLRPEQKFSSADDLKQQIRRDVLASRHLAGEALSAKNASTLFPL